MRGFHKHKNKLLWQQGNEILQVEAWGKDSLRIRAVHGPNIHSGLPGALLTPCNSEVGVEISSNLALVQNGLITCEVQTIASGRHGSSTASLRFLNAKTGGELLAEKPFHTPSSSARSYEVTSEDHFCTKVRFQAYDRERMYGLGQHQHNRLDQKGLTIDLVQTNSEVCIPFLLSSRGYGFLWNNPALGKVELSEKHTLWMADSTPQIDYWVTAGETPAGILNNYADATGHAPLLPEWACGFWQSKLRYRTQEEVLGVAREYQRRGLPLSVIVIDALHWALHGDWCFDSKRWPDPEGMVQKLQEMGVKPMVSIWPTVNPRSKNHDRMDRQGWFVTTASGRQPVTQSIDHIPDGYCDLYLYDATHPGARKYLWEQVRQGYYDLGISSYWLDVCEPETTLAPPGDLQFHLGSGPTIINIYPLLHARAFFEGLRGEGENEIVNLCRSAWAGSQRYAAAVWSGDVQSSFKALQAQVRAGMNIGLSGIPWWTSDIGGFFDEDPSNFQELIIRWFQFGAFCPIFRLHGYRKPYSSPDSASITGGPNEVWSFGKKVYAILRKYLFLRERLRPYIHTLMRTAHENGLPPMRPLFVDFPEDLHCGQIEDQYMFGPDLLVAPVLHEGARAREVYLPEGETWVNAWTGEVHPGGQHIISQAPLERIPLYLKKSVPLPIHDSQAS